MRYDRPKSNEWFRPVRTGYRMACCDCGLVHEIDFRYTKHRQILVRVRRNNRATAAMRRYR